MAEFDFKEPTYDQLFAIARLQSAALSDIWQRMEKLKAAIAQVHAGES